jgi:nucleotide-binding universal stress UspA family protein
MTASGATWHLPASRPALSAPRSRGRTRTAQATRWSQPRAAREEATAMTTVVPPTAGAGVATALPPTAGRARRAPGLPAVQAVPVPIALAANEAMAARRARAVAAGAPGAVWPARPHLTRTRAIIGAAAAVAGLLAACSSGGGSAGAPLTRRPRLAVSGLVMGCVPDQVMRQANCLVLAVHPRRNDPGRGSRQLPFKQSPRRRWTNSRPSADASDRARHHCRPGRSPVRRQAVSREVFTCLESIRKGSARFLIPRSAGLRIAA